MRANIHLKKGVMTIVVPMIVVVLEKCIAMNQVQQERTLNMYLQPTLICLHMGGGCGRWWCPLQFAF
jgi:hypothetical protein